MNVVRFPPLAPVPTPPITGPDARQRLADQVKAGLVAALAGHAVVQTTRMSGFRASAVDIGAIQEMLGRGIVAFDMAAVRDRWDDDLRIWMSDVILNWVQRCKCIHFELEENGISIRIETQDDHGYYAYELDVFPGRS